MTIADYAELLTSLMKTVAVRPAYGLHPRLAILGQLEGRLVTADTMILGGLNEGTWPQQPATDPWMSRPMRRNFGLPSPDRVIGQSAHDFVQALCADKVILTRSVRADGSPTVPSRWLQRLDTVLQAAADKVAFSLNSGALLQQVRLLDKAASVKPFERPAPCPPVSARPRSLSVTRIETWMNDPYSIYARYILRLRKLDSIDKELDAAERGNILHRILKDFAGLYPDKMPPDADRLFMDCAAAEMQRIGLDDAERVYWMPRLRKIARWIDVKEQSWRASWKPALLEARGEAIFDGRVGSFLLYGIADRIDISRDGTEASVIDYKSGGSFSLIGMLDGRHPQLPLEALLIEEGGFGFPSPQRGVTTVGYWILSAGKEGGAEKTLIQDGGKKCLAIAKENARAGLLSLIAAFDDPATPYYSLPRPARAPRFNDYLHLARVQEWTALDDPESEAAA
jgi:ATP-dependent helicase/nuclease subunit B